MRSGPEAGRALLKKRHSRHRYLAEIHTISARAAPVDLQLRHRIDAPIHEVRKSVSARLDKLEEFNRGEAKDAG